MSEINAAAGSSAAQIPTLIVSRPCRSADAVMRYISEGDFPFFPIIPAVSCAEATRTAAGSQFGIVLINSPLCDDDGISLARTLARDGCAVLLIVSAATYPEAKKAAEDGIFVLPRPVSEPMMHSAFWFLAAACRRSGMLSVENEKLAGKIDEFRIIDRAKWVLIDYLKMSEEQAHRYIEKQAMDLRIPRIEAAKNILKTYLG